MIASENYPWLQSFEFFCVKAFRLKNELLLVRVADPGAKYPEPDLDLEDENRIRLWREAKSRYDLIKFHYIYTHICNARLFYIRSEKIVEKVKIFAIFFLYHNVDQQIFEKGSCYKFWIWMSSIVAGLFKLTLGSGSATLVLRSGVIFTISFHNSAKWK